MNTGRLVYDAPGIEPNQFDLKTYTCKMFMALGDRGRMITV
jgi:hypothetical protein